MMFVEFFDFVLLKSCYTISEISAIDQIERNLINLCDL